MADAIPQNEIQRPVFTRIDVKAAVERMDPDRHKPETEYIFSNGRKFKSKVIT